jgi:hypothetical protein
MVLKSVSNGTVAHRRCSVALCTLHLLLGLNISGVLSNGTVEAVIVRNYDVH